MIRMQERFRDDGPGGANGDKVVSYLTFHNAPAFRILRAAPELEARLRPSLGGAQRHQWPAKRATRNQIRVIRPIGRIRLICQIFIFTPHRLATGLPFEPPFRYIIPLSRAWHAPRPGTDHQATTPDTP